MKKIFFFCWLWCVLCQAQQFDTKLSWQLPDTLRSPQILTADMDNDGLLDVLVSSEDSKGKTFFLSYKSDTVAGFAFQSAIMSSLGNATIKLNDVDQDNDIDILVSGLNGSTTETVYLSNDGDFNFHREWIANVRAQSIAFGDVTNDGRPELILSGFGDSEAFFSVFRRSATQWVVAHDSLKVAASSIVIHDFDKNSFNDIMVSGRNAKGEAVAQVLFNRGSLYFTPSTLTKPIDGKISLADFNADGYFDAFISGKDNSGTSSNAAILNDGHTFRVKIDSLPVLSDTEYVFADFNSDGKQDCHYIGKNATQLVHKILTDANATKDVSTTGETNATVGDYEHDGDLDIFSLTKTDTSWKLVLQENRAPVNKGPGKPPVAMAARIFNRLFLYWGESVDDHTDPQLITYDVTLQGNNQDVMLGEFDLVNFDRLTVSAGNHGTKNYALIRSDIKSFSFTIEPVDNAFHTGGTGVCRGSLSCVEFENVVVEACKNEIITFREPNAIWFSFSAGLVATGDEFVYHTDRQDTLFSLSPGNGVGCSKLKVYTIEIREKLIRKTETTKFVCADKDYQFSVESGWAQVDWSSSSRGLLSHNVAINFKTGIPDTLKVKLMNGEGCILQRNTILKISKPDVKVEADAYQIIRGEKVQLHASGASSYQWAPEQGLDDASIFNPVASPKHSTVYTVTGIDSIGCSGTASVRILVEGTAFIPNLFTPNEDGQNDDVKIYGLEDVKSFSFSIHNREGNVVYETQSVQQATAIGWDGTAKGVKQPNGVYYWKVKGEQQTGSPVQLNGKTSGAIVLIR